MDNQSKTLLEKKILGELLYCNTFNEQLEAVSQLRTADFTNPIYRSLFNAFNLALSDKLKVEVATLYSFAKELKDEIASLPVGIFTAALLQQHINILKFETFRREIIKIVSEQLENMKKTGAFNEFRALIDSLVIALTGKDLINDSKILDFEELQKQLIKNIKKEKSKLLDGFSTGIEDLDTYTNGILPSRLYVIGGLKKAGKTRFVIHLIKTLYNQNVNVAYLSLEVPENDIIKLLNVAFLNIPEEKLRSGGKKYLSTKELKNIEDFQIDTQKLIIECSSGLRIGEILNRIRMFVRLGAKVIFIDFLQRIHTDISNKVNELEAISQLLADAARQFNISIFLVSQLSNIAERESPSVAHLKGSGGIAEAADVILILDNLKRRTGSEKNKNIFNIEITQRYGESGRFNIFGDAGRCFFSDYSPMEKDNESALVGDDLPI